MAARRRSPCGGSGAIVLSERRTLAALADLLSGGYDVAHLGAPFLLSCGSFWIVAIGNCWFLPIRFVALVTAWFVAFGNCWFVAYGNCWFVAYGNRRLLYLILRIQFPRVFLTPQTFTLKAIVRVLIILSNSYIHTLSSPQKMRANGTVVTEILHFKNLM